MHIEAISCFDNTLEINPKDAEAHFYKGLCRNELNQFENAVSSFDEAIRANSTYAEAYFNKSIALAKLNRSDETKLLSFRSYWVQWTAV